MPSPKRALVLALLSVLALPGCDKGAQKDKGSSKSESDESAEDKPKSKKKKGAGSAEASATASAASTPAPTATSARTAAPTSTATATATATASGVTLFMGPPDADVKFLKNKQIPDQPVWMQVLPYWKINTDSPPIEDKWTDLVIDGKDGHASIRLWIPDAQPKWETELKNSCAWARASGCTFGEPQDGTLGEGLKMKIAEGSAKINGKPAKVWWMRGAVEPGTELAVFAAVRPDVYAKLEPELTAMLKTVKYARAR